MNLSLRIAAAAALCALLAMPNWARHSPKHRKLAVSAGASTQSSPVAKSSANQHALAKPSVRARPASLALENEEDINPQWIPMAAVSGGLGLFSVDLGDTLPRHDFSFEAGVNRMSRNPGSVTVTELGESFGYGLTDRLTAMIQFDAHRHIHVGAPGELSLTLPTTDPLYANTIFRTLPTPGARPMYVEDFPFAYANNGSYGDIDLGLKYGIFSERRGDRASLAVRGDLFLPTKTSIAGLAKNEVQNGATDVELGLDLSKVLLNRSLIAAADVGYRATRDPAVFFNNSPAFTRADQLRVGTGFIVFPRKRYQFLTEYTGTVFVGSHTPDMTFGARDPVDGVWGTRIYLTRALALDMGYRWMLNLHNVRDRSGFVVKLGLGYRPEQYIPPPRVAVVVYADRASVVQGSGGQIHLSAQASDSQNWPLAFSWEAAGGSIVGAGPNVAWDPGNASPGTYTIRAFAEDSHGGSNSNSVDLSVLPKPFLPPTMSCSVDRASVMAGEKVQVTASVNDQTGTALTYQWITNGGQLTGTGASVELDTSGLLPTTYTVTGRVQNAKGGAADCAAKVTIEAPPPPPHASKINQCNFMLHSARLDNVCKRILDDVALRMQNAPRARVVLIGYSSPRKGSAQMASIRLAHARAENAKKYLASAKGVDASRIETAIGSGEVAGKENRRVDIIWVPEGATY
jgi:outer membrane protein OmpA-like peptidoglycan-associated protein